MPSLTANDSESEDEDTLLGDDENWNEVFSTINITAEQKAQMERRKAQLAAIREIANGSSDDEGGSDIIVVIWKRARSDERWRAPSLECLFSMGVTVMNMTSPW